jgi:nitroreductase
MEKPAITQVSIHELLARRWSGRAFDSASPIAREQLIALLEAARWAPSCYGEQPWRFVVWNRGEDASAWRQALECLAPTNQAWAKAAPLLLLAAADTLFHHNGQPNRHGQYDTGAASENMCLQALALGMMTHQMGGFDADKVRALAGVPAQCVPMAMIAVGYPLALAAVPDELRERELAPRKRRELGELFFAGRWDRPVA